MPHFRDRLLLITNLSFGQANLTDKIPVAPEIKKGTLSNGLTYYIRKNSKPEKKVELRLAVKVGSIVEDDDQLGLAHFTEHMAFNGSKHFKKMSLFLFFKPSGLSLEPISMLPQDLMKQFTFFPSHSTSLKILKRLPGSGGLGKYGCF